ncbi:twin-arginine translocase subunit TatC [Tolumonas lignilytica]|uniref:twin-arginine translocase subunit TatC n=1 Tax=Tolumonas lignilytica TaxID=1283284 RepID=UPI0004636064|nr:twin-arginine translocase subunit TatC [Tolumonas lignilytica]
MNVLNHLLELRRRLLHCLLVLLVLFLPLSYFANAIYHLLATPLLAVLPQGTHMIATAVSAPFLVPLKLTLLVVLLLALPYLLWQIWGFLAPALYRHEQRWLLPLLFGSNLLFYTGIAFAYYVVLPLIFRFMVGALPTGVSMATDIGSYLDFVLTMFFSFGAAFQLPLLIAVLCRTGVTSVTALKTKRPHFIVLAFIVGMLLSPPDVLSQTLLAVPLCLLFEAGLWLAYCWMPKASAITVAR